MASQIAAVVVLGACGGGGDGDDNGDGPTDVVQTSSGPVQGLRQNAYQAFLGIPYAAPPVGPLRWKPPAAPSSWTATRQAVHYGPTCAQDNTLGGFAAPSMSEDCLYLNVFTPLKASTAKRPVMVWIHGGGLFDGASDGHDPRLLMDQGDVVFVSMNYRLNVFGFFSHPAINTEGHANGNYGFLDQQFALKWVQQNVARFGGDPDNVTIFGESSGGQSVWAHIAAPSSAGLFHKAIVESSQTFNPPPLKDMEPVGMALADAIGCADQSAACLRTASPEKLLAANTRNPYTNPASTGGGVFGKFLVGAMTDGDFLPEPIAQAVAAGRFNRVPLLNGTNFDERAWFVALAETITKKPLTAAQFPGEMQELFGDATPDVMALYPLTNYPSPSNALAAAAGDRASICGARRNNRGYSQFVADTYAYEFEVPDAPVSSAPVSFPYRSYHTAELQFIFPGWHGATGRVNELSPEQQRLALRMARYWTSFASRGTPNGAGHDEPEWPRYRASHDNYMVLRTPEPAPVSAWGDRHHCNFWDQLDG